MAQADVEAVIKKAVTDDVFRLAISRDIEKALKDHQLDLTADEIDALKKVDWSRPLPTNKDLVAGTWVHVYKTMA